MITRRRVTLASVVTVLSGSVVLESWRAAVAGLCLVALGWIGAWGWLAAKDLAAELRAKRAKDRAP